MRTYYMPESNASQADKLWTWLRTGNRFRPSFPGVTQTNMELCRTCG